jgi:predicted regulator of Ras-like GTPase activity (Roadblock/LC7/MglB family)
MFTETLNEIADRMQDVYCVLLMGMDGMPIDKVTRNKSTNVESISAEFTALLRVTRQTSNEAEAGKLDEMIVLSDEMILVMKAITTEYFLMLILPPDANLGRARFELKKAKYELEKEFE